MKDIVDSLNELFEADPLLARSMCFPVAATANKDLAHNSMFEFGSPDGGKTFWLSPIGFLNGAFPLNRRIGYKIDEDGTLLGFCWVEPIRETD